jgi:hypothetical protein
MDKLFLISSRLVKYAPLRMTVKSMITTLDTGVIAANSKHPCPCRKHFRYPEKERRRFCKRKIIKLFSYTLENRHFIIIIKLLDTQFKYCLNLIIGDLHKYRQKLYQY